MTVPSSHDLPGPSGPRVLWTRDFVLLLGSAVLLWCSFYLQLTTLPVYIVQDLGGSSTQVGLLSTLLSLAAMVVRPIAGSALDRFGRRPVHLGTLLVFCFFTAAHGVPGGLAALFAVRVVHGLPFGAVTTAMHTVTADLVPEARRGEGIGYAGLPGTVATAIAPSVALSLLNNGSFSLVTLVATALSVVAWLLALGIRHPQVHDPTARPSLAALLEPRVGRLSWVSGLMLIGYGGVISFVTLYAEQLGISQPGWFFSVYALGSLASRPIAGPLFDRRGPRLLVLGSLAVLLVSYLSLGRCTGEIAFLSAGFLMGLGLTSLVLALQTMAVNVVPPARRGAANATLFSAVDLGIGLGSLALGALADAAGSYGVMFTFAAGLLLIPAAMFFLWVLPSYERQMVE
jgi:MFS family permease